MASDEDQGDIENIVLAHGRNFLRRDADALARAFDDSYDCVSHLPTEADTYLRDLSQIREYYGVVCSVFCPTRWDVEDLLIDFPSENVAFALCRVLVEYSIDGQSTANLVPYHSPEGRWEGRCRYIFRRSDKGWKIIHLEDSTCEMFRASQLQAYHQKIAVDAIDRLRAISSDGTA